MGGGSCGRYSLLPESKSPFSDFGSALRIILTFVCLLHLPSTLTAWTSVT